MDADDAAKQKLEAVLGFPVKTVELLGEGVSSKAMGVNDEWVFLFPKHETSAERLEILKRILPHLQKKITTKIPVFEFVGRDLSGKFGFVGYPKIKGLRYKSPNEPTWNEEEFAHALPQLATFINELHAFPVEEAHQYGVKTLDYNKRVIRGIEDFKKCAPGILDSEVIKFCVNFVEGYFSEPVNLAYTPTLIHRDLHSGNMFFDKEGNLAGVIDFNDLKIGNPDSDLVAPYRCFGQKRFWQHFMPHYLNQADDGFKKKLKVYVCFDSMDRLCRAVSGSRDGQKQRAIKELTSFYANNKSSMEMS